MMDLSGFCFAALLLHFAACVQAVFVEPPLPVTPLRTLAESETRLPCRYQVEEGQKVVQVSWSKELPDGSKDQIITAHFSDGYTEFGRYSGRVRFESSSPTEDSALLILNTEESDEGSFTCHISTFPNGNFERRLTLTVWIVPISSLDPVVLAEGQSFRVAAACRAVGRPLPRLSWETNLPGVSHNRTTEGGSVSSYYSLHPLRSMNGKQLDCLVWHPALEQPRRIPNRLVVQYPPDATITTSTADWYVGLEKAELLCDVGGFPKPQNITWTWRGGALPNGASVLGGKLIFGRGLRLNDSGLYECVVRNSVGEDRTEFLLTITETCGRTCVPDNLVLIVVCSVAGALVLLLVSVVILVNHRHQHRNKKLKTELSVKTEEISTLSRQASFRRLNSVNADPRVQGEDYALLRVDSRMKNSDISLERPTYKGSQPALSGKWGPAVGMEVDELGRPVVWGDGREELRETEVDGEKEERRRRVESYLKSSNMSLVQPEDGVGFREPDVVHVREGGTPSEDWGPAQPGLQGYEDDGDSSTYQISEALTNHFYYSNGVLRPKLHSNAILLHPKGQVI
ncbi:nectin-4 isoform X2 [Thalassophryne amazonica]|uniref:nectin-4 isoform X2 n=1 Tax=Thalassophryne amazonica TaxID=390379 RepID=UPI001470E5D0|nr:nectin-4 isoform X2 [Thalassophryne amazonica]